MKMICLILFGYLQVHAEAVTQTNIASEANLKEASFQDEDLKQANEWIDKAEQPKGQTNTELETKLPEKATAVDSTSAVTKTENTTSLNENQIPVLTKSEIKKKETKSSTVPKMAISLGILVSMIVGGVVFVKRWSKKTNKSDKNKQIKILSQHFLGPRKSLAIIRVAGESILIGVTDHNISLIKSLALIDDEIPSDTPEKFSTTLTHAKAQQSEPTDNSDEFAISKIKDFVSDRLKGMKEI